MNNADITKALSILETILEKRPIAHQELIVQATSTLGFMGITKANSDFHQMLNEVICRYESNVGVKTFDPDILVADPGSDVWFTSQRDDVPRPYFERYCTYLRELGWDNNVIVNLGLNCEKTLSRCANPKGSTADLDSKKRGMVMGDVQAGKTANYLGLINMACDYGYHVIVLLAGLTNSLRKQTQDRVDYGFIGAYSKSIGSGIIEYIGVGEKTQQYYGIPLTNADWDFKKFIQKTTNAQTTDFNKPVILVVKKNASILRSVHEWLKPGKHNISGDSILIIDDEADNASPNTNKPDYDPTAVNRTIRAIYNNFPIASYIGFTATPFANIFINPYDISDEDQDLFPHDFIVQLNPPNTYFGGERIFPENGLPVSVIRLLDTNEPDFIPVKHKKDLVVTTLPESLKEAILGFLINNVVRTLRGDKNKHRSMMINVTALNDPQESVNHAVNTFLTIMKNIIEQDSYKNESEFIKNAEMRKMYDLYMIGDGSGLDFYAPIRSDFAWVDIQRGLYAEIKLFETTIINNRYSGDMRYDYTDNAENGSRVIVIGGFVLSRGLTLEGLCVSYYNRSATAYDTLLQMCRWFGYRPRYDDLCRIYLSQASIDCFNSVMEAVRDLKNQFSEMELHGKTPSDFGLMVKESPSTLETTLVVTARNKMRHTQVFEQYINYGGVYPDTSKLFKDAEKNRKNRAAVDVFFEEQQNKGITITKVCDRHMLCRVSNIDIAALLRKLYIPSGRGVNQNFNCDNLSSYTEESKVFQEWDVVIATGSKTAKSISIQGYDLPAPERTFSLGSADENYIRMGGWNNRILDPGIFDSGINITPEQKEKILSEKKLRRNGKPSEQLTARDWLKLRERPLLVIYFIDLKIDGSKPLAERDRLVVVKEAFGSNLLVGFAIGFPEKEDKVLLTYRGNLIKANEVYSDDEEFDEEELSDE